MRTYLSSTFSPMMLKSGMTAIVEEVPIEEARGILGAQSWESSVGHEVTAKIIGTLFGFHVPFNRSNISIGHGDQLICVIPAFRADVAREFSHQEIVSAGYRAFLVSVEDNQ